MRLTIREIADMVRGTIDEGDQEKIIEGVSGLSDASSKDISFLSNMKYLNNIYTTQASAVLVAKDLKFDKNVSTVLIRVERSDIAFATILALIDKEKRPKQSGIHPNACIGKNVTVGNDVFIGPYVVIEDNARIGSNCHIGTGTYIGNECSVKDGSFLYPNVTVLRDVEIGVNAVIHSGTVIGSDGYGFVTEKGVHSKIPQIGGIRIGDNVEIGSNVSIDRGTTGNTLVGSGTKIDNLVHIAHNVKIGENCLIIGQVGISGSTTLGKNVTVAGQAGIIGHVRIGDNVVIGGGAAVIGSIPPGTVVSGSPARPHREAMKIQGYLRKLPELFKKVKKEMSKKTDTDND